MAIDIDDFEEESSSEMRTNADRVLDVLLANEDAAFRSRELAEAAGVDPDSVGPVLTRLRQEELVRHRSPYWAIEDPQTIREELAAYDLTVPIPDCGDGDEDDLPGSDPGSGSGPGPGGEPGEGADPDPTELVDLEEFLDVADSLWDWARCR